MIAPLALAVVALANGEVVVHAPAGWILEGVLCVDALCEDYRDSETGAVVSVIAEDWGRVHNICDLPGAESVTTGFLGREPYCLLEGANAHEWQVVEYFRLNPNVVPTSSDPPNAVFSPAGSRWLQIQVFLPEGVWTFVADYCSDEQHARILSFVMDPGRPDPSVFRHSILGRLAGTRSGYACGLARRLRARSTINAACGRTALHPLCDFALALMAHGGRGCV